MKMSMQPKHEYEVINMLDGAELDRIVKKHQPDYIVLRWKVYEQRDFTIMKNKDIM